MSFRGLRSPLLWLGGLLALYLVVPIVVLFVHLGTTAHSGFATPGLGEALAVSVLTATISAALIVVFGVPLAYVLARSTGRLAGMVGVAVQLPLALPPLISGILLLALVGPYTFIGRAFGGRLTDSLAGIVIAQTFVSAPFLVIAARSAFAAVNPSLLEVGATLGLGELARFARISLPLALPGIAAGVLLAWLRAFGEFGATVILAYHPYSLPVYTYVQFSGSGLTNTIAPAVLAVAAALVALGLLAVLGLGGRTLGRRRRAAGSLPAPIAPPRRAARHLSFALNRKVGSFHLELTHEARCAHVALLGASGAGKSTTLRALAGLLAGSGDRVQLGDQDLGALSTETRSVGYVPQDASLFPHRTVWRQLVLGRGAIPARAAYWLERLGLGGLEDRLPSELSGGQRQRVALARALCRDPDLLLLDEPLSSLDAPVRRELRTELRRVLQDTGMACVVVTHEAEEAALLADEVVVIDSGRLLQAGARGEIFGRPRTEEVARLLGLLNVRHGRLHDAGRIEAGGTSIDIARSSLPPGALVLWRVAPELVSITRPGGPGSLPARVVDVADLGASTEVQIELATGVRLVSRRFESEDGLAVGDDCHVNIPADVVSVWAAEGVGSSPSDALPAH